MVATRGLSAVVSFSRPWRSFVHSRALAVSSRVAAALLLLGALACAPDSPSSPTGLQPDAARRSTSASSLSVPSAPTNVQGTPGKNKATVTWQAPASTGGSAILYYLIVSSPGNIKTVVAAPKTTGMVIGLQNGTAYRFTVLAVNAVGVGPASAPSAPVTPTATSVNQPPTAVITAPANGATVTQGAVLTFTGRGTDPETGTLSGASLVWTSSINGQIGIGAGFSISSLAVGTHTITLTAKDPQGATGTATISVTVQATTPPPSGRWVTGYYVGYQQSLYPETSVDFSYLTHVIVGTAEPTSRGGLDTSFWIDPVNGPRMARHLTARAHQFGRKAIMMIGGAGYDTQLRSATASAYRATFVANLVKAMNSMGFDGIDVDWEPINSSDQPTVVQFLKDLRAAKPGLIITFPVTWVNVNFPADSWYAQLAPLVDQFNMMSYEMADNWGGWVSWHTSALFGNAGNHPSSVASSAAAYRAVGIPASKIGIGIGAYGSCWQGVSSMLATLVGSAGVVASDNAMSYTNIVSLYYKASAYHWDATAQAGYLSFSSPTGPDRCTLVSYDDPQAVTAKGAYAKSQGFGGAIMWTIGEQHLPNAASGQQDPLMRALYTAIQ